MLQYKVNYVICLNYFYQRIYVFLFHHLAALIILLWYVMCLDRISHVLEYHLSFGLIGLQYSDVVLMDCFIWADTAMQLKRDSAATGSWSIQDEIRRVRSRATEDLLRSLPSSKIDWSAFAMENKNNVNSSAIENIGASLGERVHNSTNLVDASVNLARGLGSQVSPGMILLL